MFGLAELETLESRRLTASEVLDSNAWGEWTDIISWGWDPRIGVGVSRHPRLYRAWVALIGTKHDRVRVHLQGVRSSHRMGSRHRLGRLYRVWYTSRPLPTECSYFRSRLPPPRCPLLRSTEDLQEHPPQRRMGPSRTKFRFQERSQQGPISFSLLFPYSQTTSLSSLSTISFPHFPTVWDIMVWQPVHKLFSTPLSSALP
jgi:hypothetical protein